MIIGVVKEIKAQENRVGLTPYFVSSLFEKGHNVIVEKCAGEGSYFSDDEYRASGAKILGTKEEVYNKAEMIVKVKEPLEAEYSLIKEDQIIFSYLHLATTQPLLNAMLKTKAIGIAYETVTDCHCKLPLLAPMSCVAGRMSILMGCNFLQRHHGGHGVLISGVPGVLPSNIAILGGGFVGRNAAFIASGLGANVIVLDKNVDTLQYIDDIYHGKVKTLYSSKKNIIETINKSDIIVCAAYLSGELSPILITKDMINGMKKGSVIVDVSIDQGGCCEISRQTSHKDPVFEVNGVLYYGVPNMPGAYPRTSTIAINDATYPYVEKIANMGYEEVLKSDKFILDGLNTYKGKITHKGLALSLNRMSEYCDPKEFGF